MDGRVTRDGIAVYWAMMVKKGTPFIIVARHGDLSELCLEHIMCTLQIKSDTCVQFACLYDTFQEYRLKEIRSCKVSVQAPQPSQMIGLFKPGQMVCYCCWPDH